MRHASGRSSPATRGHVFTGIIAFRNDLVCRNPDVAVRFCGVFGFVAVFQSDAHLIAAHASYTRASPLNPG